MKTEGLTWAEAIKAYANGERIRDKDGDEFWLEDGQPRSEYASGGISRFVNPAPVFAPFSIVKPEPKRLSFDEVLELFEEKTRMPKSLYKAGLHFKIDVYGHEIGHEVDTPADLEFLHLAHHADWVVTLANET